MKKDPPSLTTQFDDEGQEYSLEAYDYLPNEADLDYYETENDLGLLEDMLEQTRQQPLLSQLYREQKEEETDN